MQKATSIFEFGCINTNLVDVKSIVLFLCSDVSKCSLQCFWPKHIRSSIVSFGITHYIASLLWIPIATQWSQFCLHSNWRETFMWQPHCCAFLCCSLALANSTWRLYEGETEFQWISPTVFDANHSHERNCIVFAPILSSSVFEFFWAVLHCFLV